MCPSQSRAHLRRCEPRLEVLQMLLLMAVVDSGVHAARIRWSQRPRARARKRARAV